MIQISYISKAYIMDYFINKLKINERLIYSKMQDVTVGRK